ncbi:MAG: hypothetical protein O7E52_11460 [Candidatus Poribacteria bacterium]|nr:hypothetical protein [Candidatus Poribacteria bacterium]
MHRPKNWSFVIAEEVVVREVVLKEPLTQEMIDAGANVLQHLDEVNLDVQAALWVYLWESNRWWLVFALPGVQEKGRRKSYQKIHAVHSQIPADQPNVHWSDISVVEADDRFIFMLRQRTPAVSLMSRIYISQGKIHHRDITEAYIYRLRK